MSGSSLRVIVSGMVGLYPLGGVAWDYLQYVIGLAQLGHDTYYHEDTWCWPYHPGRNQYVREGAYSARFIQDFFRSYAPDLQDHWHYRHLHEKSYGMEPARFNEVARTADVFLNVSGGCIIPEHLSPGCVKVFVDTDPGYNQIVLSEKPEWSENVDRWCANVKTHDRHFTYAENIRRPDCGIPRLGFSWKTTRMPVVVDFWKSKEKNTASATRPWTTIMTWNAFKGRLIYKGVEYKSKGNEFLKMIDLPGLTGLKPRIAVGGVRAPLKQLAGHGWEVLDGPRVTRTPQDYRDFIQDSRGEISTAKHVYVALRTGWFSCRSACYLAAGRPVVVQDTGFNGLIPTGKGILAFSDLREAIAGLGEVEGNYRRHAEAARAIAWEYFDAKIVLRTLMTKATDRDGREHEYEGKYKWEEKTKPYSSVAGRVDAAPHPLPD
jgi:hypothetical protein